MTITEKGTRRAWGERNKSNDGHASNNSRPITATLSRPAILNTALINKLDMTTFTKEGLLVVSKLCAVPILVLRDVKGRCKKPSHITPLKPRKEDKATASRLCHNRAIGLNVNWIEKTMANSKVDEVFDGVQFTEPCQTCGRPEQPERLHSHPTPGAIALKTTVNSKTRKSVAQTPITKPVSAKFKRSTLNDADSSLLDKNGISINEPPGATKCEMCSQQLQTPEFGIPSHKCTQTWKMSNELATDSDVKTLDQDNRNTTPFLTCYICQREFGSKSMLNHQPQCLRKWKISNANLPPSHQQAEPVKSDAAFSRIVGCYICGEQINGRERLSHERSCLQLWRRANSAKPVEKRLAEPQRPDFRFSESGDVDLVGTWHSIWENHMDSLIPCKKCGRKFFADRITRHESACANVAIKVKTVR